MKMYLIQKQIVKEAYRYFMTLLAGIFFLIMIFYVSSSNEQNNNIAHYAMVLLLFGYAVSVPLFLFKNLYHPVNVCHASSFPMTRFEFFFSQYFLGLAFGLLIVLSYTSLTSLLANTQDQWILQTTYLMVMFAYYYHLSIFCFWICGNKMFYALMVIFCTVGPLILFLVYQWVMETFAIGYICPSLAQSGIEIFLPIYNTLVNLAYGTVDGYQLFYLGISIILLVLSMVAVHYRQYEKTGQSITFVALGYFIRLVIALLCSTFLLALTGLANRPIDTLSIFISYLVVCLIVVYCIEMIFTKNTRVFYSLKYGVLLSVTGFFFLNSSSQYIASYIPSDVQLAVIAFSSAAPNDFINNGSSNEQTIESIRELHQTILDHQENVYASEYLADYGESVPVRILYQTGERSYSERLYYCDLELYSQMIRPYLNNREIFDMVTYFENSLLTKIDSESWYIRILIEGKEYNINSKELRYLFKNYLKQELDAAYEGIDQFVLEKIEDGRQIEILYVKEKNENDYQYLSRDYYPLIERAVLKTFKE